jgi:hypothetical protein
MWLKWRHKYAHGPGSWVWTFVGDWTKDWEERGEALIEDYLDEKTDEYNWSDKYRGIEHELVERPPDEVIAKEIERLNGTIERSHSRLVKMWGLLKSYNRGA